MNKNELRIWAKEKRKELNIELLSKKLVQQLQQLNEYKQAKNIMIFYPIKGEINLLSLLDDKSKNFYLPRIDGKNLLCCPFKSGDELCVSCFKTKEPLTEAVNKNLIDLVIVPALCCDKQNYRLGYGGGFYDRFLQNRIFKTIVCLPKELLVDTIYPEEYDVPVDIVVT